MRRALKIALVLLGVLCLAIQFVRPARTNPATTPGETLTDRLAVPAEVAAILDRSCGDCHSNDTRWPWYSNVAPVSWFVIDHVDHGRSHFNYSKWGSYDLEEATDLLKESCTLSRKGGMPIGSYLLMHSSARVSPREADLLCGWTQKASQELTASRR